MESFSMDGMSLFAMAGGQGGASAGGGMLDMVLMMAVIMGLMYFMVMRPQQKREKARQEMLKRIKAGDKVRSIGGILGEVVAVTDKTITVCVADKVNMEFVREAVTLLTDDEASKDAKKSGDSSKK